MCFKVVWEKSAQQPDRIQTLHPNKRKQISFRLLTEHEKIQDCCTHVLERFLDTVVLMSLFGANVDQVHRDSTIWQRLAFELFKS